MMWATLIVLLIAASRIAILQEREFTYDEVLNAYRTSETLWQALLWVPVDWPPLHFVLLWVWQAIAGAHPVVLRYSSVLLMLLGAAFLFRASHRICQNDGAAWCCTLIFGALGYSLFTSTSIRGYSLVMCLYPLAFWVMLRFFDQPTRWRGAVLAVAIAALFYTSVTTVFGFVPFIVYAFMVYGRRAWRGLLPALGALVLVLPELIDKLALVAAIIQNRALNTAWTPPETGGFVAQYAELYVTFAGSAAPIWFVVSGGLLAWIGLRGLAQKNRAFRPAWFAGTPSLDAPDAPDSRILAAFVIWGFGLPLLVWAVREYVDLFSSQYAWWIVYGVVFALGGALATLPRIVGVALGGVLVLGLFVPLPTREAFAFNLPFEANLRLLQEEWRTGDVLLIDPNCVCGSPVEWQYFQSVYFPNGLDIVETIGDQQRIWYMHSVSSADAALRDQLVATRAGRKFFGPPGFFFRVYERPPDPEGIAFANGMRFHGATLTDAQGRPLPQPPLYLESQTLTVQLWWSADRPIERDYSVGVHLRNETALLDQSDGSPPLIFPDGAPSGTSYWEPGRLYIAQRQLTVPAEELAFPDVYTLYLTVYHWQEQQPIAAPGLDDDGFLPLLEISTLVW